MCLKGTFICSLHPNSTLIAEPPEGTAQCLNRCSALRYLSSRKQVVCYFLPLSNSTHTHTQYTYLEKFSLLMTLTFSANNIFSTGTVQVNRVHSGNRRSRIIWESVKMNWPEQQFWKHSKLFPYLDKCSHLSGMSVLLWLVLWLSGTFQGIVLLVC